MRPGLRPVLASLVVAASVALAVPAGARPKPKDPVRFQAGPDGRIALQLGTARPPEVVTTPDGAEIRFAGTVGVDLAGLRALPGVSGAVLRTERGRTVLVVRGKGGLGRGGGDGFTLVAATPKPGAKPAPETDPDAPSQAELDTLRRTVASKLAQLNGEQAPAPRATAAPAAEGAAPSRPAAAAETPAAPQDAAFTPARPPCPPIDMAEWGGKGAYADAAVAMRARMARSPDDLRETAALAEFYVAHGLPHEALALIRALPDHEADLPGQARVTQARDIAQLMRGRVLPAASPLFEAPANCERGDAGLWQALNAAAGNDAAGVAANARKARAALTDMPEPLRTILALRVADAAPGSLDTQKSMLAVLRNNTGGAPDDVAGRWMIQARIAAAEGNTGDEALFLEHVLQSGRTVPGLTAQIRLAAAQLRRAGEAGELAEKRLADFARTYRYDELGADASLALAQRSLDEGDYARALTLADAAALVRNGTAESRGARFAAKVLRLLLVDSKGAALPSANDRIALFWRNEGYATPGERGDDIRIGAARLLLQQGFAAAALDVTHQLAPANLRQPPGLTVRAQAEALAGDAHAAIAMLQTQPQSDETNRVTADALARLGRPVDAARAAAAIPTTAGREERAELLYGAGAWTDAAGAYADLLRDPAMSKESRDEATRRYAQAASLAASTASGKPRNPPPGELLAGDAVSSKLLAVSAQAEPPSDTPPVASVRSAIDRSRKIETLLSP